MPAVELLHSPDAATLFLGGEDDFDAAMPAAFPFVAAFVCWFSCYVVDSPAAATLVLAALSGRSALLRCAFSAFLRRLGLGAARAVAAISWDGCRGVAEPGLGPVIAASRGCFQSFPRGVAALLAALEMVVGAVAVRNSSSSQYEWVELESDYEPEPPCTMLDTQGSGCV